MIVAGTFTKTSASQPLSSFAWKTTAVVCSSCMFMTLKARSSGEMRRHLDERGCMEAAVACSFFLGCLAAILR